MNVRARPSLLVKAFKTFKAFGVALVVFASSSFVEAAQTEAGLAEAIRSLEWRSIGPANMGGRVTAVVGIPGDAKTLWVAGADGGLWKTINAGVTFEGQFQNEAAYSVGHRSRTVRYQCAVAGKWRRRSPELNILRQWGLPLHRRGKDLETSRSRRY